MLTGTATTSELRAAVLLDTSVAIAVVQQDHELHAVALAALGGRRLGLAGHAWFETYSVLTRLPAGQRRPPEDVVRILVHDFPESVFLGPETAARLGTELAPLRITGGAVYDALVAAVAREHGLPLLTADDRARPTYEALGITVEWL
jgi:predicted nucleic acid-binding protein